jgi:putative endonuclease
MSRQALPELLKEHQEGRHSDLTRREGLIEILWVERQPDKLTAIRRERQLKGWSHAKKAALIRSDLHQLKLLSRSKSQKSRLGWSILFDRKERVTRSARMPARQPALRHPEAASERYLLFLGSSAGLT